MFIPLQRESPIESPVLQKGRWESLTVIDSVVRPRFSRFTRIECGIRIVSRPVPSGREIADKREKERERSMFYLHASYTRVCVRAYTAAMHGVLPSRARLHRSSEKVDERKVHNCLTESIIVISSGNEREREREQC